MKASTLSGLVAALVSLPFLSVAADDPAGLIIEVTHPVSCTRKSQNGDMLAMDYRGTLQSNGQQFDKSKKPFKFKLGAGQVIKGWDQGLLDMCIGEGRKLTIPPSLGYGSRDMGAIPPNSVLIFTVSLVGIDGVTPEQGKQSSQEPPTPEPASNTTTAPVEADKEKGSEKGPKDGEDNNECKLLGQFAILIQSALGGLALLALVWKRWRETPRRPVLIWSYDVSKQVVGSIMLHFANLFLSMLSSGSLEIQSSATSVGNHKHPNPCSFYLLNLAIDTTIGIPILVFFLYVTHKLLLFTPLANPPESLTSGNYGSPPRFTWWTKQALLYFIGLFCMKFVVFLLFQIFPWLGWVGDWALRWTEGKEWVQILFVMLVFPLIMNVAQYWIIDNFIKDKTGAGYGFEQVTQDDDSGDDEEGEARGLMEDAGQENGVVNGKAVPVLGEAWKEQKAAGALPLPAEFEDEEGRRNLAGSSISR